MSRIDIVLNNRPYTVQCEDGQEAHLQKLARYVDQKIGTLTGSLGQVGETRLFMLAALTLADELHDVSLAEEKAKNAVQNTDMTALTAGIIQLADRIDAIAVKLEDN